MTCNLHLTSLCLWYGNQECVLENLVKRDKEGHIATLYSFIVSVVGTVTGAIQGVTTRLVDTIRPPGKVRQPLVDVLRGLALLGILIVNIEFIVQSSDVGWAFFGALPERIVRGLIVAFGQTKVYPLFAMLFGYGFSVQLAGAARRKVDLRPRYRRRMIGLAVLGVLHGIFFFPGDILLLYACVGGLAFRLRERSSSSLLRLAAIIYVLASVVWLAVGLADLLAPAPALVPRAAELGALAAGGVIDVLRQHLFSWPLTQLALTLLQGPAIFAFYLVGMVVGRGDLLAAPHRHREFYGALLRRLMLPAVVISTIGAWLTVAGSPTETLGFAVGFIAAPGVAASYLAIVAMTMSRRVGEADNDRLNSPLNLVGLPRRICEMVGRASLSVYLLESVAATSISYGYGLGRFGIAGPLEGLVWAVTIWLGLAFATTLWLRWYRHSLLEWVLRSVTYGERQPFWR